MADTVGSEPLSNFEAKLLHPFSSLSRDWSPLHLLFGSFAAMLTPELLPSFLTLLLQTLNDVDRASSVHLPSAG